MKMLPSMLILCISAFSMINLPAQKGRNATITMGFQDAKEGDSIMTIKYKWNLKTPESLETTWHRIHNGRISIRFDSMQHPGYFTTSNPKWKYYLPDTYLIEPGDNILVQMGKDTINATGKGSEKLMFWNQYHNLQKKIDREDTLRPKAGEQHLRYTICDKYITQGLQLLESYRKKISPATYHLLMADLIGEDFKFRLDISGWDGYKKADSLKKKYKERLYRNFSQVFKTYENRVTPSSAMYSFYWQTVLVKKYLVDSFYLKERDLDLAVELRYFQNHYKGGLRDYLITSLLNNYHRASDKLVPCLREALTVIENNEFRAIVEKQYLHYLQGSRAYNFSLRDTTGRLVRLTDFAGKTILMDFWYTGCLNCIEASTALQSFESSFLNDPDFVFLSISIDRDKGTWLNSVRGGKYTAKGRINLYTDQRGYEDPLIKHYDIRGYPTLMMIDKKGNLLTARLPDPRTDNGEPLIKKIKEAISF